MTELNLSHNFTVFPQRMVRCFTEVSGWFLSHHDKPFSVQTLFDLKPNTSLHCCSPSMPSPKFPSFNTLSSSDTSFWLVRKLIKRSWNMTKGHFKEEKNLTQGITIISSDFTLLMNITCFFFSLLFVLFSFLLFSFSSYCYKQCCSATFILHLLECYYDPYSHQYHCRI